MGTVVLAGEVYYYQANNPKHEAKSGSKTRIQQHCGIIYCITKYVVFTQSVYFIFYLWFHKKFFLSAINVI